MRIIEFGPVAIFARTHPEITTWISTGTGRGHPLSAQAMTFGFRQFARLVNCLRDRGPGLVACHVPKQALPRCRLINAAYETILRASVLPVVGLDFCDTMILTPTALRVLERCSIYFKRELPFNRAAMLPTGSAVERDTLRRNLSKIIPVSLGLGAWRMEGLPDPLPTKSTDVFFSGKLHSATRRYGATLLSKLDAEGIRVDLSTVDIDRPEYLKRMADAHLAWSPEGLGWQTFRVFEAAAAGSVPIVNRGQIEMPDPLRNGEHCFYYDPQDNEQDNDLIRVIKQALSDKERLNRMGEAARAHVLRHHTHKTVVNQIMTAVCDRHPSLRSARYP